MGATITGVVSPKGGVGKTTASLTIASICAGLLDQKTLLIDSDGQNDSTRRLRHNDKYESTLYDIIVKGLQPGKVVQKSKYKNLFLLPSDPRLLKLSAKDYPDDLIPQFMLRSVVDPLVKFFDQIIIDSPGYFGDLLKATVCAAHHVLVPISLEDDCVNAFETTRNLIESLTKGKLTRLKGPVRTFFFNMPAPSDLTKTQKLRIDELKEEYTDNFIDIAVPAASTKVLSSNNQNTTLFYGFPNSSVSKKYVELTSHLVGR